MIKRFDTRCKGCGHVNTIRLGMPVATACSFYWICGGCGAARRGRWSNKGESFGDQLELEDGKPFVDNGGGGTVTTIHPDIPSFASATEMHTPGGSPFFLQMNLLGDRFYQFKERYDRFVGIVQTDLERLRLLVDYYLDRDWTHFDRNYSTMWPEEFATPTEPWHRHKLMHHLLDWTTRPILDGARVLRLSSGVERFINPSSPNHHVALDYMATVAGEDRLLEMQAELLRWFMALLADYGSWLPGFYINSIPTQRREDAPPLRVWQDNFAALRDHYIRGYELIHHAIEYPIALANCHKRGDSEVFGAPIPAHGKKGAPKNMGQFNKLTNFKKSDWLKEIPEWNAEWPSIADRPLRNGIGHATVKHDLRSGLLAGKKYPAIEYSEFLAKLCTLIEGWRAVTWVIHDVFTIASRERQVNLEPYRV